MARSRILVVGDSIASGFGLVTPATQSYPAVATAALVTAGAAATLDDQAVSGTEAVQMMSTSTGPETTPWYTALSTRHDVRFARSIGIVAHGHNDLAGAGETAVQTFDRLSAIASTLKREGYVPLIITVPPSGAIVGAVETARLALNVLILASAFQSWDINTVPQTQDPLSVVYYQDQTHPTAALALLIGAALALRLLPMVS